MKSEDEARLVEEARLKSDQEEEARFKAEYEALLVKDARAQLKV